MILLKKKKNGGRDHGRIIMNLIAEIFGKKMNVGWTKNETK